MDILTCSPYRRSVSFSFRYERNERILRAYIRPLLKYGSSYHRNLFGQNGHTPILKTNQRRTVQKLQTALFSMQQNLLCLIPNSINSRKSQPSLLQREGFFPCCKKPINTNFLLILPTVERVFYPNTRLFCPL